MEPADWVSVATFEGLATVFEDEAGTLPPEWRHYDRRHVRQWAEELFGRPIQEDWRHWKFEHPDGRRYIAYRVGAWLVDEAVRRAGRSAAELLWEPAERLLELAEYEPT